MIAVGATGPQGPPGNFACVIIIIIFIRHMTGQQGTECTKSCPIKCNKPKIVSDTHTNTENRPNIKTSKQTNIKSGVRQLTMTNTVLDRTNAVIREIYRFY